MPAMRRTSFYSGRVLAVLFVLLGTLAAMGAALPTYSASEPTPEFVQQEKSGECRNEYCEACTDEETCVGNNACMWCVLHCACRGTASQVGKLAGCSLTVRVVAAAAGARSRTRVTRRWSSSSVTRSVRPPKIAPLRFCREDRMARPN